MQAFQLRIDLGGMGGMQGAATGSGSGGQAGGGAFAGMLADASASDAGASDAGAPGTGSAVPAASAQASGKGIGVENLQVLQPDAAEALPAEPVSAGIAAPALPEAGTDATGPVPGWDAADEALEDFAAGDAVAGDDADSLTGEPPLLMAFAMPVPLPAPQAAVSAPLDGVAEGAVDGTGGLESLEGTDGLRGSIQPFAPALPQAGGDADGAAGTQPGRSPSEMPLSGDRSAGAQSPGAQSSGAQAGALPQSGTEAAALPVAWAQGLSAQGQSAALDVEQPAVAAAVLPDVTDAVAQPAQSLPRAAAPQVSSAGLETALADAGLTAGAGETVPDDLVKLAAMLSGPAVTSQAAAGDALADVSASGGQSQAQNQTQMQAQPAAPQQSPAQPAVSAQTQTFSAVFEPGLTTADPAAQAVAETEEAGGIEALRFAFASSAGADASAAAAKPELVAQQAVASSTVADASDSLTQTALDDAVSAREAADAAVTERVEERLADQESSRYRLPSNEGTPLTGQSASARGTQASDLAGASAAVNGAQAAAGAAAPDASDAGADADPVVALDGRPGQMDFTGFGRADGTTGPMAGTAQAGTASTSGQLPTQAQAQAAASQVAGQMQLQSRAGQSRFQMRLDPPELGRIEVHMKVKDGGDVEAHLIVDKPETLDMFMRDQKGLERALEQAGLKADQGALQFSLRDEGNSRQFAFSGDGQGNGSGQQGRQDQQQGQDGLTADQNMAERVVQLYRQNGRSGVDIRI